MPSSNDQSDNGADSQIVYRLPNTPWAPRVIEEDGELKIVIGVDFNRGYDIREYFFPVTSEHLEAIRTNLSRHLLLWCVLEKLCEEAGSRSKESKPNKKKARQAIDLTLLGGEPEVEKYFQDEKIPTRMLVAHGANIKKLEAGRLFAALGDSPTAEGNWDLVWQYDMDRDRARRGIHLNPLDVELLKYLNKYSRMGTVPYRKPDAVDPTMLPEVLKVIEIAEEACAETKLPADKPYPAPEWSAGWRRIEKEVQEALQAIYPDLSSDTVDAISFLMGSEAADRVRGKNTNS